MSEAVGDEKARTFALWYAGIASGGAGTATLFFASEARNGWSTVNGPWFPPAAAGAAAAFGVTAIVLGLFVVVLKTRWSSSADVQRKRMLGRLSERDIHQRIAVLQDFSAHLDELDAAVLEPSMRHDRSPPWDAEHERLRLESIVRNRDHLQERIGIVRRYCADVGVDFGRWDIEYALNGARGVGQSAAREAIGNYRDLLQSRL